MTTIKVKNSSDCAKCSTCKCRCCKSKSTRCSHLKKISLQSELQVNNQTHHCFLILVRHGLSQDEVDKHFSGWNDCDLSSIGIQQMHGTGQALNQAKLPIDICFTSMLKRASKSLFIIQEEMDYLWLPVYNTWRLNDRMLGSLTCFHRERAEALFGKNQIKEWLTRPDSAPPLLEESSTLHPRFDYRYHNLFSSVPSTESLFDIRKRLSPFFYDQLLTNLYIGKNILLVTHEDIVKALIRLINDYPIDEFINNLIPIGIPLVFEFSVNTHQFINGYYLSSMLLENNIDDQHELFPTGFLNEKQIEMKHSTKQSTLVNYDVEKPVDDGKFF